MCHHNRPDVAEILIDAGAKVDLLNEVSEMLSFNYDNYYGC